MKVICENVPKDGARIHHIKITKTGKMIKTNFDLLSDTEKQIWLQSGKDKKEWKGIEEEKHIPMHFDFAPNVPVEVPDEIAKLLLEKKGSLKYSEYKDTKKSKDTV